MTLKKNEPEPHETQTKSIKTNYMLCSVLVNIDQQKKLKKKYLKTLYSQI